MFYYIVFLLFLTNSPQTPFSVASKITKRLPEIYKKKVWLPEITSGLPERLPEIYKKTQGRLPEIVKFINILYFIDFIFFIY